jgi:A/G-specific adenine glycosylase
MVEGVSSLAAAGAAFAAIGVAIGPPLAEAGRVTHVLTHRRMAVTVVTGRAERLEPPDQLGAPYEKSAWLDPVAPGVGVSTLARKILTCAGVDEKG